VRHSRQQKRRLLNRLLATAHAIRFSTIVSQTPPICAVQSGLRQQLSQKEAAMHMRWCDPITYHDSGPLSPVQCNLGVSPPAAAALLAQQAAGHYSSCKVSCTPNPSHLCNACQVRHRLQQQRPLLSRQLATAQAVRFLSLESPNPSHLCSTGQVCHSLQQQRRLLIRQLATTTAAERSTANHRFSKGWCHANY
jgi:hypothetical protein